MAAVLANRAIKISGMGTIGEEDQGTISVEVGTSTTTIEATVPTTVPTI
jgi:hypothetical protein